MTSSAFLAALVCAAPVFGTTVFNPIGYSGTEAPATQINTIATSARTVQFAFDPSVLGFNPGDTLMGLFFRADTSQSGSVSQNINFTNFDVQISQSVNPVGSLSTTFASNIGPDVVMVRSGALSFVDGDFPLGGAPNALGPQIVFTAPYLYTGGTLLVTIRHTGGGHLLQVDAVNSSAGNAWGLFGLSYAATTATGTTTAAVIAFDVMPGVPEPGTEGLAGAGLLGLALFVRIRFRRPAHKKLHITY